MPGDVIPAWTRESRRHGRQIHRFDDAGLNRRPRPTRHSGDSRSPESLTAGAKRHHAHGLPRRHARSPLSGRPESLLFVDSTPAQYKDSGFRIGEEYSRYASLFLYRTE